MMAKRNGPRWLGSRAQPGAGSRNNLTTVSRAYKSRVRAIRYRR